MFSRLSRPSPSPSRARARRSGRLLRCSAIGLFLTMTLLMVIGAVVGPDRGKLQAQEGRPGVEEAKPAGEIPQEAVKPIVRTTLTFEVDPEPARIGLTGPTLGSVTSDRTPKIRGTAHPGQSVQVLVDGQVLGLAKADDHGEWSIVPAAALGPGSHTVQVAAASEAQLAAQAQLEQQAQAQEEAAAAAAKGPAPVAKLKVGQGDASNILSKAISFLGIFALIGVAVLLSNNRRAINWRLVAVGTVLQLGFAVFIFYVPGGKFVFDTATSAVAKLLEFTGQGSTFIFRSFVTGQWEAGLVNFTFAVLPTIIFFSSIMTVLYHVGIMQKVVKVFATVMQKAMGTSGAESLSAAANIFVGQTEAPLVIKPYVDQMTNSELMTVMTGGFATVAGGVLAIYVGMLQPTFPDIAGHLLAASVMSAPAALVIGKIMYPETQVPVTGGDLQMSGESEDQNVIDAASRGAAEGLQLALNVGAMLLAFIAIVALINYVISWPSLMYNTHVLDEMTAFLAQHGLAAPQGCGPGVKDDAVLGCIDTVNTWLATAKPEGYAVLLDPAVAPMLQLEQILGYLFWPFAFVMGVPVEDCMHIGRLLGEKFVLNELVAYSSLQRMLLDPTIQLSDRSVIIATYALCGFANLGSIGIQLGGIGGIAPSRRGDLARIAFRAMVAGTLAAFMTATVAGILV